MENIEKKLYDLIRRNKRQNGNLGNIGKGERKVTEEGKNESINQRATMEHYQEMEEGKQELITVMLLSSTYTIMP